MVTDTKWILKMEGLTKKSQQNAKSSLCSLFLNLEPFELVPKEAEGYTIGKGFQYPLQRETLSSSSVIRVNGHFSVSRNCLI